MCYTSPVRPILEFNSIIWSGCSRNSLIEIEAVQRRATKFILNYNGDIPYNIRVTQLDLLPLSMRRDFLDLTFMYNCFNDLVDFNIENYVTFIPIVNRLRNLNDPLTLLVNHVRLQSYDNFYVNRIIHTWNQVPLEIRMVELTNSGTNASFKRDLKNWLSSECMKVYNVNNPCTWKVKCICNICKNG